MSGTRDPFGLRRRALGILRILLENSWEISLGSFIDKAVELLGDRVRKDPVTVRADVLEFFRQRFHYMMQARGFPHDTIEAVISRSFDDVYDAYRRIEVLHAMRSDEDFEKLILGCKRAVNILAQAGKTMGYEGPRSPLVPEDLAEEAERQLYERLESEAPAIASGMKGRQYRTVLEGLANLKGAIDRLFDDVMILVEDETIKERRLNLLYRVASLFQEFADFSKIIL